MRIWDLPPKILCTKHLLSEHRSLHMVWTIITRRKKGYKAHPETGRWVGKTKALYKRHQAIVKEIERRGFLHRSPLDKELAVGEAIQRTFVHSTIQQRSILKEKRCRCIV